MRLLGPQNPRPPPPLHARRPLRRSRRTRRHPEHPQQPVPRRRPRPRRQQRRPHHRSRRQPALVRRGQRPRLHRQLGQDRRDFPPGGRTNRPRPPHPRAPQTLAQGHAPPRRRQRRQRPQAKDRLHTRQTRQATRRQVLRTRLPRMRTHQLRAVGRGSTLRREAAPLQHGASNEFPGRQARLQGLCRPAEAARGLDQARREGAQGCQAVPHRA